MNKKPDPEVTDPALKGAAEMLRGLRADQTPAPPSLSRALVERVKPVAARRRRTMRVVLVAALLSAVAFAVLFFNVVME